ncbi:hypothetical protein EJB05_28309, partial [Eragrostis curvula]
MEASSRVLLLFMLTLAATTTLLSLSTTPCSYSTARAILAATGLDPYLISCNTTTTGAATEEEEAPLSNADHGNNRTAKRGGPIVTDLLLCGKPEIPEVAFPPFQCCPPMSSSEPITFKLPDPAEPLRTRRPVHEVGPEHMAKYERAVALMKALPKSDPRSFYQQANIHCAYCTGAYRQVGRPELRVQVHYSWLFFPFHRAYIYFFERIAAKLLGDPGFTVPVWTWDVPEGMRMPAEFVNESSPLYDPVRDPGHLPPKLVDLDFWEVEKNLTDEQQLKHNMWVMYKQMISGAPLPSLFHGQPYRAGDTQKPGAGTAELAPHNTMHAWIGNWWYPNGEDMGAYYAAGRDPIFYAFHANVDRLWEAWRRVGVRNGGDKRRRAVEFNDLDWLDSSFLFYDEEARLVRVKVRDMLDTEKLRYRFSKVAMPWAKARPPTTPGVNNGKRGALKSVTFPVSLDAAISVEVMRPPVATRSRLGKVDDAQEEVLVIEGIEVQDAKFVKFDVYVNAVEYQKVQPGGREMAGSFVSLRHPGKVGDGVKTSMRVALNELLEDLGVKEDKSVTVTLVPVKGKVRIGGIKIVYMSE